MIQGSVSTLPNGSMGFDITSPLNPATALQYFNKGYRFVVRYVGRGDGSKTFVDLSQAEGQAIVDASLGLCVVQHPLKAGWSPTAQLGQTFGAAAASLAGSAGLPAGVSIFLDLEGVNAAAQAQDVIDYGNAWFDEVSAVNYVPGIYIGASPGLTDEQMYWDLKFTSYWRGGSSVGSGVPADIPNRGYQMTQRITDPGTKTEFDSDVATADNFGGAVQWCVAN